MYKDVMIKRVVKQKQKDGLARVRAGLIARAAELHKQIAEWERVNTAALYARLQEPNEQKD